jgi:hypothetical protein
MVGKVGTQVYLVFNSIKLNILRLKYSFSPCLSDSTVLEFERLIPNIWGADGITPTGGGFSQQI